jgi:membrane fusion protein (multidrug efflux system)
MSKETSKKLPFIIIGLLLMAAIGLGVRWYVYGRFHESTDNAYVRADTTFITPRVGGEVVQLLVKNNQAVKAGDVLLKLDDADYQAKVANAKAVVAMREAALLTNGQQDNTQTAFVAEAQANYQAAKAEENRLLQDLQRAKTLVQEGVATKQRLDNATALYQSAQANTQRTQAAINAAQAQKGTVGTGREQALAELDAAKAALKLAELDLASTEVHAPIDGVVGDLAARLGSRVAAGNRLLAIVPVANVFVEANFKETQLTQMHIGQEAEIKIDAYGHQSFTGHIDSISPASGAEFALLPPDNATGNFNKIVQRLAVKVLLDNGNELLVLRPGMSAEVTVSLK